MAVTHAAAAVITGTTLGAHTLTFDCLEKDTEMSAKMAKDTSMKTDIFIIYYIIPGQGLFPHFCISTGRPVHCTVTEVLTQVLLLILRPPPQVTEHAPHRPHGLHLADQMESQG